MDYCRCVDYFGEAHPKCPDCHGTGNKAAPVTTTHGKLEAAVRAYVRDKLSVDEAAQAAGITKVEFLQRLGGFRVSALRTETIEEDAETARQAAGIPSRKRDILTVLEVEASPGGFQYLVRAGIGDQGDLMLGLGVVCRQLADDPNTDGKVRQAASALLMAIASVGDVS